MSIEASSVGSPSSVEKDLGRLDELLSKLLLSKLCHPLRCAWVSSMIWGWMILLPVFGARLQVD